MAGKNKIMQAVVSFAGTIDPSLGKAMDNVVGHLDKVNWKAVAVGAAVGGIAVATGKAVVEAGKYLAELGDDYNKAMNQLSASTGATGDELDALGESVKTSTRRTSARTSTTWPKGWPLRRKRAIWPAKRWSRPPRPASCCVTPSTTTSVKAPEPPRL